MSPERLPFIKKLKIRKFSPRTVINYEQALVRLAKHYNKSPLKMSTEEIEDYVLHALEVDKLSPATVNLHIGAFKTFFHLVKPQSTVMDPIGKLKNMKKLPCVLTATEIAAMSRCTKNLKHKSMVALLYSSGIRLSECLDLRPCDIDGKNKLVHVVQGKGAKERYTIISTHALQTLRQYYGTFRPKLYLFEGRGHEQYARRSIGKVVDAAAKRAGIKKKVTPHMLRKSCLAV